MPMVIRIPFGGGIGAVEHHSESPEALVRAHRRACKVVACSNPVDGYWMIQQAIACDDPVIFLEPKRQYHADKAELDDGGRRPTPLFGSRVGARQGTDVTLLGLRPDGEDGAGGGRGRRRGEGTSTRGHRPAHAVAARHGAGPRRPYAAPAAPSSPTRRTSTSAWAPRSPRRITEQCFYSLEAPVLRVGGFDMPYPPSRIEEEYLPDLDRVLDAVDRSLAY